MARSRRRPTMIAPSTALLVVLVLVAWAVRSCDRRSSPPPPRPKESGERARPREGRLLTRESPMDAALNLAMGNPSGAGTDPENYLLARPQLTVAYSSRRGVPHWASWHLRAAHLGDVDRSQFHPDDKLPAAFYRVKPNDYTGSGYDRGHLCPSADRTATVFDNLAVFTMANIIPQTADNNRGPWEKLESYCRDLVRRGHELYIVAGAYGNQGAIGRGRVVVPARTYKVVVVLDDNGAGPGDERRVTTSTRVIAVEMPNSVGIKEDDWRLFRISVDALERSTGYDFLSGVAREVQEAVEAGVDRQ